MTQLSIMIALLAALALGNATYNSANPVQQSGAGDSVAVDQVNKVEPPQELGGGGEGGFPGF